jgi:hypothetical protein
MNRRRLEVEAWRDAMLQAAGRLDERSGGESFDLEDAEMVRRTLYGRTSRQGSATLLRLFDFPELTRHTETRTVTTTPLQQLYFLNNPFVIKQANAIASQIYLAEMGASSAFAQPEARQLIAACYHLLLQREPSAAEIKMAHELLDSHAEKNRKVAWLVLVQSLMVSSEFLFVD